MERPVIKALDELAEGIYAASGCYTVIARIHQRPEVGRGDYRIQVDAQHRATHTCNNQWLHISFNKPVSYVSSQGNLESGNGTNTLVIHYHYWNNPNDNIGLGDLIVQADAGLEVVSCSMTDDGTN